MIQLSLVKINQAIKLLLAPQQLIMIRAIKMKLLLP